ncbi:dolichol kinase [Salinigranum rubrum]|uniref:Dolichol kinase n=1 Tax=Salinigranum rubrum TaxID=755307 RepID=A0A2I8VP23_9EURY|nr:dolichol kinase [Salinigranum rubrum]AUV83668.1 dolichol kinase [Salinigranum rubrum]
MSELQRRLVHASGSLVPLGYLAGLVPWSLVRGLVVVSALVATVLEVLRLGVGLDWAIYDRLTRDYEQDNPAGYALYTYSMAGVALVFSPPVAVAGMLMLAIGDPISGLMGSRDVGETKRATTLLVMFGVCLLLAVGTFAAEGLGVDASALLAGAVGAAGATLADGIKPVVAGYVVDDNLSIPPTACVGMWLVLSVLR